jgi:hypothetical protein
MGKVVISQPFFFPWIGHFQLLSLADEFVVYDDVQFARGFINRVKIASDNGPRWLTVPLQKFRQEDLISQIEVSSSENWIEKHLNLLRNSYRNSPYLKDIVYLYQQATSHSGQCLGDVAFASVKAVSEYLEIDLNSKTLYSSRIGVEGKGSGRILAICAALGANTYISGHGGARYLQHEDFELHGIDVRYIDYSVVQYPQPGQGFVSHLSVLDVIANLGPATKQMLDSNLLHWRDFLGVDGG